MTTPFTLSIEDVYGHSFQYGYHLGTDEALARTIAAEKFHARVQNGFPVVTVALMRDGKMVDCYDGRWANDYDAGDDWMKSACEDEDFANNQ
jgi:hypothetical protein